MSKDAPHEQDFSRRADRGAAGRPLGRGPRAKAKKLEAEIEPLKEEFERRGLSVVAAETWGVARSESTFASLDVKAIRAEMGPEWRPRREKPREARVHQFRLLKGAVMAAYWSTLADQSLFDTSRFFGRQEEARAFDRGFAAEFLGALRTEDFAPALAEGASATLIKVLAFVVDEMRPRPLDEAAA